MQDSQVSQLNIVTNKEHLIYDYIIDNGRCSVHWSKTYLHISLQHNYETQMQIQWL